MALSSMRAQRWGVLLVRAGLKAMAKWMCSRGAYSASRKRSMPSQIVSLSSGFHSRGSNVIEKYLLYLSRGYTAKREIANNMDNLCICSTVP